VFPELQVKFPVVAGIVEKADCTLLVFMGWLKVMERAEETETPVESWLGVAALSTG
jgi:hypothetical protein